MSHVLPINYNNFLNINNNPIIAPQISHNIESSRPVLNYNLQKRMGSYNKQNDDKINPRQQKKFEKSTNVKLEMNKDIEESGSVKKKSKECDGYDSIGCYVVRVYYDWFLVNGSCKCWKLSNTSQTNSINDAIKRIFIGKW